MITEAQAIVKLEELKQWHKRLDALVERPGESRNVSQQQAAVRAGKLVRLLDGYDGIFTKIDGRLSWMNQRRSSCGPVMDNGKIEMADFRAHASAAERREILDGVDDLLQLVEITLTMAEARLQDATELTAVHELKPLQRKQLAHSVTM